MLKIKGKDLWIETCEWTELQYLFPCCKNVKVESKMEESRKQQLGISFRIKKNSQLLKGA